MTTTACRAADTLLASYLADPGTHRADLDAALAHIGSCAACGARAALLIRSVADVAEEASIEDLWALVEAGPGAEPPSYPVPDLSFLTSTPASSHDRGSQGAVGDARPAEPGRVARWADELRQAVSGRPRFARAAVNLAWAGFASPGGGTAVRVVVDNLGRSLPAELTRRPGVDASGVVTLAIHMPAVALSEIPSPFDLDVLYVPSAAVIHREAIDDAGRGRLLSTWGLEIAVPLPDGEAVAAALADRGPGSTADLDPAAFAFLISWPDASPAPEPGAPGAAP